MRAAAWARTSSRSRDAFTSSPISVNVASKSADISVDRGAEFDWVLGSVASMNSIYYSRHAATDFAQNGNREGRLGRARGREGWRYSILVLPRGPRRRTETSGRFR